MRNIATRFQFVTPLLIAALASPSLAAGEIPAAEPVVETSDVALTKDGLLAGQVRDAHGRPQAGATVRLYDGDGQPVEATTNERGQFAYRSVPAGVYCLQCGDQVRLARVWSPKAAPPRSQQGVLLVADADAILGQYGPPSALNSLVCKTKKALTNPLVWTGIIATAVAIPVAVHNSDSGS